MRTMQHDESIGRSSSGILQEGTSAPDCELYTTPDQKLSLPRPARAAGDPGVLPRRLEPRVWRSINAVQRSPFRIPALQCRFVGNLGRWDLVSYGICARSQTAFPAAGR